MSDAPSLFLALSPDEVSRVHFSAAHQRGRFRALHGVDSSAARRPGHHVCFGIVPRGLESAVGLSRSGRSKGTSACRSGASLSPRHTGAAVPSWRGRSWSSNSPSARFGVHRLEAACCGPQWPGQRRTPKEIGAVQEGVLRRSYHRSGESLEIRFCRSILRDEWRPRQTPIAPSPDFLSLLESGRDSLIH